jgi:adenylate cyclase
LWSGLIVEPVPVTEAAVPRTASPAWLRQVRLGAGLILFTYVFTHLVNHAFGLVSLAAMQEGQVWFLRLWRNPLGTVALYGALIVHALLALWFLYERRTLHMPLWQTTQAALGLSIPPLLLSHVMGTRMAYSLFGTDSSYTRVLLVQWYLAPEVGLRQALTLVLVWIHGCMGVHFWLRFQPWYPRARPLLFAIALLVPVLALLGFADGGREVARLAARPGWVAETLRAANTPGPPERATLARLQGIVLNVYSGALGAVLLARGARSILARRRTIRIAYPSGRTVQVAPGFTVLEASRSAGIPHASVCGGRGRCSTCRIRIVHGLHALPLPSPDEVRVLRRVGAPPNVRLACQLRPRSDIGIVPLLPSQLSSGTVVPDREKPGREQEVAVLFADLRGFTRLAEHKLPYDVVFFLNRYFEVVGTAIERAGGIANQFTGDGVMALFGVDLGPDVGARQALAAARALVADLAGLSRELTHELPAPLRMGIGIHVGHAVVGRMGYGPGVYLTAVGDTVHVASRLEQLTKEYDCELVITEEVARHARIDTGDLPRHELTVRNRAGGLAVYTVARVAMLAPAAGEGVETSPYPDARL